MRGDGHEVGVERLDVHDPVRSTLGRIADHDRAAVVRPSGELLDGVHAAERVRDHACGDDPDPAIARELVEGVEPKLALVVERQHPEVGPGPVRDVLPGYEVGVVLELGDEHDVAGPEVVHPPGICDDVDRLGRVSGEDDLTRRGRIEEATDRFARAFVAGCRTLAEHVHGPVDVRVRRLVELRHRVDHLARLLRAVCRIQVGERLPMDQLLEDREVGPLLLRVELRTGGHGHPAILALALLVRARGTQWRRSRPSSPSPERGA